jgi:TrmH family RNA methyltransferase
MPKGREGLEGPGARILRRLVVVLYEPQDLLNIALVVRAMKNMGLTRLRLIAPAEFDAYRIEGIAHDTRELVAAAEVFETFDEAVEGAVRVVATTARRRASRQAWDDPESTAANLVQRAQDGDVAIVFGREDWGLPNDILDRCQAAICIPTSPDHSSLNLGHAAIVVFYELRKAVSRAHGLEERSLHVKLRDQAPPATAGQLEEFFRVWEEAMGVIGMFRGIAPASKMRSYRRIFKRAEPDRRELRLLVASAYRIVRYARRLKRRLEDQVRREAR